MLGWFDRGRFSRPVSTIGPVDLGLEYDELAKRIVKDHASTLARAYATSYDPETILRHVSDRIKSESIAIRTERLAVPRKQADHSVYTEFLKNLYGTLWTGPSYQKIFDAYLQLPHPPPLYIEPTHFEKLVSTVIATQDIKNGTHLMRQEEWTEFCLHVLTDMVECDLQISPREYGAAIYKLATTTASRRELEGAPDSQDGMWQRVLDKYKELEFGYSHRKSESTSSASTAMTSALNVMLSLALRLESKDKIEFMIRQFALHKINPNRHTILLYLRDQGFVKKDTESVKKIYQDAIESGMVPDTMMVNTVMMSFLYGGEEETAEEMLKALIGEAVARYGTLRIESTSSSSQLLGKLQIIDHLVTAVKERSDGMENSETLKRYAVPLVPDHHSFKIFIGYNCEISRDFPKAIRFVNLMKSNGCEPDREVFYYLFRAFRRFARDKTSATDWSLDNFRTVVGMLVDYQLESRSNDYYSFQLAIRAIQTFGELFKDELITKRLFRQLNSKDSVKRLNIHRVYTQMLEFGASHQTNDFHDHEYDRHDHD